MFEWKLVRSFMQWHCWRWVLGLIPYFHHCFEWEWDCVWVDFYIFSFLSAYSVESLEWQMRWSSTDVGSRRHSLVTSQKTASLTPKVGAMQWWPTAVKQEVPSLTCPSITLRGQGRLKFFCFNCFNIEYTTFDVLFVSRAV